MPRDPKILVSKRDSKESRRERKKEPKLHYKAVSKGVHSSEPHPEACWLEPTFKFA